MTDRCGFFNYGVVAMAQAVALCFCILSLVAAEPLRANKRHRSFPWYFIRLKSEFSRSVHTSA